MTEVDHNHNPPPPAPPRREPEAEGSSALRLTMLVLGVVALGLYTSLSALLVVFAIVVMIFLHELGHYVTARAAGMKCTEFFIGFGPRIWSFQRGETEYGVKAIPAGAYVKVIGMTNLEEVDPADEDRTYRQKSYWRRMSVAVAGSAMHFLIALVVLFALLVGWGIPDESSWEVGRLAGPTDEDPSPAGAAGIRVGDDILAVSGTSVSTFEDVRDALAESAPGDEVLVTVERSGATTEVPVELGDNGDGGAFLGISPDYEPEQVSVVEAVPGSFVEFADFSGQSIGALVDFFSPSGLSSFVSLAVDASDPVEPGGDDSAPVEGENRVLSIYGAARLGTQAADSGAAPLLGFLVLINIFIGIFNLVPLLPLDGGHVAVATYERVRELLSRSHARYHADVAKLLPLTYVVVFLLVSVGLVALYLDIADPIDLPN